MTRYVTAALTGAIFGLGIAISGMANPAKVLNFFDLAGTWDPSLAFVMGGALLTTAFGYRLTFRARPRPVFEPAYRTPPPAPIDRRLLGGAATFGLGWGIAGFCPGGSLPALGLGHAEPLLFVGALVAGIATARWLAAPGRLLAPG